MVPKEGSIESCVLTRWIYKAGDKVDEGDLLCEVETDKSTFDLEAPGAGTLLEIFYGDGSEVPVLTTVAVIGDPGEDYSALLPKKKPAKNTAAAESKVSVKIPVEPFPSRSGFSSPRARMLAREKSVPISILKGSGPDGAVVEKDVRQWLSANQPLTPAAAEIAGKLGVNPPQYGTGIGGRVTTGDLKRSVAVSTRSDDEYIEIPISGIRKVTAEKMFVSVSTTAQYTLAANADAEKLLECRARFKASPMDLGMRDINITDMLLFATSRALSSYKELNCHFLGDEIRQFNCVHLAIAVETPKGLIVPVIREADRLAVKEISAEARRLAALCRDGKIQASDITGGTFTLTNLGAMGINMFTPILNIPQVAILGVGGIDLKPININGQVAFKNRIGLSLTVNHQVVDGFPAARFLRLLSDYIANIDLLMMI